MSLYLCRHCLEYRGAAYFPVTPRRKRRSRTCGSCRALIKRGKIPIHDTPLDGVDDFIKFRIAQRGMCRSWAEFGVCISDANNDEPRPQLYAQTSPFTGDILALWCRECHPDNKR